MSGLSKNQVALVVNQDAGKVPARMKQLRALARRHELKLRLCDGADLDYTLREVLINPQLKRLIIGGGDGSVSLAASLIVRLNSDIELAILPLGTANQYARTLGLRRSLQKAFDVALSGTLETRHICTVNNRHFILGLNVGTASRMFAEVTDEDKQRFGRLAYLRGILRSFRRLQNHDLTIDANGVHKTYASTELVVLNQHISEPIKLVPDVKGADPYFEIITYGLGNSKLSPLFGFAVFVLTFGYNQKYLKRIQATEARIMSEKPQPVAVDGDSLEETPLTIELIKKPIRFVSV